MVMAEPGREFRAVWLTSVYNIDWPHSTSVSAVNQQNRLRQMLDVLQQTNINAVLFQVRPNADALYRSNHEPWSHWITGTRGREPDYDPLALVIHEARKRGMEVHAWLNPYRYENIAGQYAGRPGDYAQTHPTLIFTHDNKTYFNPGKPETTHLIKSIIVDLITNYDLDGVVFDDYFYPSGIPLSIDQEAYNTYGTDAFVKRYYATNTRDNFRRASVNNMIKEVHDTIKSIDPSILFGVSPAGIYSTQASAATQWGTTLPAGISGRDNYNAIYCDPLAWLHDGSVDYLSPQLYWQIGGPQDYAVLAEWWGKECKRKGRHCYPSIGTYRLPADSKSEIAGTGFIYFIQRMLRDLFQKSEGREVVQYSLMEIENQIKINRNNTGNHVLGSIFFSTRDLTSRVPNLAPYLQSGVFAEKAIAPETEWLPALQYGAPIIAEISTVGGVREEAAISVTNSPARKYLLYGWEQLPAKADPGNDHFMQVIFGKEFALFHPGKNKFFAVQEYMPNRETGFLSEVTAYSHMAPVETISPKGQTICDMFQFTWTPGPERTKYQVFITGGQDNSDIQYVSPESEQSSFYLPSGILEGQAHFSYRVRASHDLAVSYSAASLFFTGYPATTSLNAPRDNQQNVGLNPTLQWNAVPGTTHYHLQIATDESFAPASLLIDQEPVTFNFYYATLSDQNRRHFARVRSKDNCGYSAWSAVISFVTHDATPIAETKGMVLRVFPNPASRECQVEYPEQLTSRHVRWYNATGQLQAEYTRNNPASHDTFSVIDFPPGIYSAIIATDDGKQYVFKLIKMD